MRVRTRRGLQLAILVPMVALALVSGDAFVFAVGVAVIPLAVFQWAVWLYLRSKLVLATEMGYDLPTMRDRVEDKLTLAQAATAGAVAGLAIVLRAWGIIGPPPRWFYLVIIGYVLIIIAVPALGDLRRWRDVWLPALRRRVAEDRTP